MILERRDSFVCTDKEGRLVGHWTVTKATMVTTIAVLLGLVVDVPRPRVDRVTDRISPRDRKKLPHP